jgi:hypothetical protein
MARDFRQRKPRKRPLDPFDPGYVAPDWAPKPEDLPPHWTEIQAGMRWRRIDGAVVRYDDRTPNSNPVLSTAMMFTAWEPDPSVNYLSRESKRGLRYPRRWELPLSAMKAVDTVFPLKKE